MANPFKEAELRKQEEARRLAEEARKREEEEAKKREAEAQTQAETEQVAEENNESVAVQEEEKTPVVQEAAPVSVAVPETAAVVPEAEEPEEKDLTAALREQIDADMDKMERKVAINIMVPPSLKRKMERDIRNKKFRSMSYLITALLREYYK